MNQLSYKWTFHNPPQRSKSLRSCPLAVVQTLPLATSSNQGLPPAKWRAKSAWLWRSVNSNAGWPWIPLAKHLDVPPQKDQGPWPWPHHYLLNWRTLPNWWIPPLKCAFQMKQIWIDPTLEEISASPSHPDGTPEAQSVMLPSYRCDPTSRGGQQGPLGYLLAMRSTTDNALSEERSLRFWDGPLPEWVWGHQGHKNSEGSLCPWTIREAEAHCHAALISKAEIWHATCIKEAEARLCSCLRRGRESLLFHCYQGGRVPRCPTGPPVSAVTCQGHSASRGWSHWQRRRWTTLPSLPPAVLP